MVRQESEIWEACQELVARLQQWEGEAEQARFRTSLTDLQLRRLGADLRKSRAAWRVTVAEIEREG